jgi:hypothetical protein
MENSIFYKEKYLKYKNDYLNLKELAYGGGKNVKTKAKMKIFPTYYALYIILDSSSYEALKRKVLHNDLSIDYITKELLGCGLKITEESDEIIFLTNSLKKDDISRQIRRMTGSIVDVRSPEYKLKDNTGVQKNVIATMSEPYSLGSLYTYGPFIEKISKNITSKLQRKSTDQPLKYNDIPLDKPFVGTMLFRFSTSSCDFIEAHKLVSAQDDQSQNADPNDILIVTTATIGEAKLKLIKDEHIYNPTYTFITITE